MPFVPALCTQCGSKLEVDTSQEAAVCPYCHTPFITEKAINNYNTTNITNIGSLHADVVQLSDERSIENRVKSGDTFIKLGEYESARAVFESLINDCPYDSRSWMGMTRVYSKNYTDFGISKIELDNIIYLYSNAKKVAGPQNNNDSLCDEYITNMRSKLNLLAQNTYQNISKAKSLYASKTQEIHNKIASLNREREKVNFPGKVILIVLCVVVSLLSVIEIVANGLLSGIVAAWVYGSLAFGLMHILSAIWEKASERKVSALSRCINEEEKNIARLNHELQQVITHQCEILEKATGKTPNYQDI